MPSSCCLQRRAFSCLALWLSIGGVQAGERWAVQFFHDADDSSLSFRAISFASERRGLAAGELSGRGGRDPRPMALVTSDAGTSWSEVPLREPPVSLFSLDESAVWLVTKGGVWFSEEAGRGWRKILSKNGLTSVLFLTRERGWAVGARKTFLETRDAGRTWSSVNLKELGTSPDFTTFHAVQFATARVGMVTGNSQAPRKESKIPVWMDANPNTRMEWPSLTILLETRDGGASWKPQTVSAFGAITRLRLDQTGRGLALIEFFRYFPVPAEIMSLDLRTGRSEPSYRAANRAVTDVALLPGGAAYAAAVETTGKGVRLPVPSKLKLMRSTDLKQWTEMPVDYRATATRVVLDTGSGRPWAATDTGMILKLITE